MIALGNLAQHCTTWDGRMLDGTKQLFEFPATMSVSGSDLIYSAAVATGIEQRTTVTQLQTFILSSIAQGALQASGALTGSETVPVGKSGLFQTTVQAIANFSGLPILNQMGASTLTGAATLTGAETVPMGQAGKLVQASVNNIAALAATYTIAAMAPVRQSIPVLTAGQVVYQTSGYTVGLINVFAAGFRLNLSQYHAIDGQSVVISDPVIIGILQPGMTVDIDAITSLAVAGAATVASVAALDPANQPAIGTLTGAEIVSTRQGAGLYQTTFSKLAQWMLQTYQGFTQNGTGPVAQTIANALQFVVTPENFGAVGNGVTDDSAAFTKFQTWAKALPLGARVTLNCTAGKTYTYALPYWPFGITNLIVNGNGCKFLCTATNSNDQACLWTCPGPQLGTPGLTYQPVLFKLINSTAVGNSSVTTINPADASAFTIGETIMVASYDMIFSGQPPCFKFFEYPIVTSVNPTTGVIGLDRPLKYNHLATFPYLSTLTYWSGMASIYKVEQAAPWNIQHVYNDVAFAHSTLASANVYCTGRSVTFNRCSSYQWLPTAVGHLLLNECTQSYANLEFDKLNEIIEVNGGVWPANIFASFSTNELKFKDTKLLAGYTVAPKKLILDNVEVRGAGLSETQLSGYGTVEYLSVRGGEHYQLPRIGVTGVQITIGANGVTLTGDVLSIPINTGSVNQFITQCDIGRIVSVVANNSGTYVGTGNFATITNITGDGVHVLVTLQQNTPFVGTESLNIWQEPTTTSIEGVEIAGSLLTTNRNYATICRNRFSIKNLLLTSGYSLNQVCDGIPKRIKVTVLRAYTGSTTGNINFDILELAPSSSTALKIDLTTTGVREQTFYGSVGLSGAKGESAAAALSNNNYWSYFELLAPTMASTSPDQLPIIAIDVIFENDMFPANTGD
jgi:hypothetical protein